MKTIFLICLMLIGLITSQFAQDQIYKTDGSKIEGKVLEVYPNTVKYKLASNPDGPDYGILLSDVLLIVYKNGSYDMFSGKILVKEFDSLTVKYGKNFIAYNLFGIVFNNLFFSYERILYKGFIGIRVPVLIGFNNRLGNLYNKVAAAGLDVNFYPNGQGRVRYFIGPSFETGLMRFNGYIEYNGNNYSSYYSTFNRTYYNVHLNNGVLFQPTKHFNISAVLGIGIQSIGYNYNSNINPNATFEMNFGYKF